MLGAIFSIKAKVTFNTLTKKCNTMSILCFSPEAVSNFLWKFLPLNISNSVPEQNQDIFSSWLYSPPTVCPPDVFPPRIVHRNAVSPVFVDVGWWWTNSLATSFQSMKHRKWWTNHAPELYGAMAKLSVGFNFWKNVSRGNQTRDHQYVECPC